MCSKGTNLGPAQQSSAGLLPLEKGGLTVSLRRLHQLTSVAFGATSFPRKEAIVNDINYFTLNQCIYVLYFNWRYSTYEQSKVSH